LAEPVSTTPAVLVLTGTTASGKTEVSIPLALALQAEIVNADSRQVFRELVIGSAPPDQEQLDAIKHHFVSTKSLSDRWTAGDFAKAAREVITSRAAEGKRTLVVGGSMLYIKALIDGLYATENEPHINYTVLRKEWDDRGSDVMYEELQRIDPEVAAKTEPTDHHRALRAIGHFRMTGQKLSDLRRNEAEPLKESFKLYFLYGDRAHTYERVNHRAELMLKHGLVAEVHDIMRQGFNETNTNALRTHGYQEVFPHLRGECDAAAMLASIQQAVRNYVKRQLTWYRREPRTLWVFRSFDESPELIAARILRDFTGEEQIVQKEKPAG